MLSSVDKLQMGNRSCKLLVELLSMPQSMLNHLMIIIVITTRFECDCCKALLKLMRNSSLILLQ